MVDFTFQKSIKQMPEKKLNVTLMFIISTFKRGVMPLTWYKNKDHLDGYVRFKTFEMHRKKVTRNHDCELGFRFDQEPNCTSPGLELCANLKFHQGRVRFLAS